MKPFIGATIGRVVLMIFVLLCILSGARDASAQKLKAEEIIARHLESLGGVETLQSVTTRVANGTAVATFKSPTTGQLGGPALMASDGPKNLIHMLFSNTNYESEKIVFDGSEVKGSYVRPGQRTVLADFLLANRGLVKQGIFGGALSQAWPLLDMGKTKLKVEAGGTKKIDDRVVYQLKCYPAGSDVQVTFFFDGETFRHVRTEYSRTAVGQMGSTPETSASQIESRYKMIEEFSDFKKEGGLMLPHSYRIQLEITSPGARSNFKGEWLVTLAQFQFNQAINPASFDVAPK